MINCVYTTFRDVGLDGLSDKLKTLSEYILRSALCDYVLLNTCNRAELYSTEAIECKGFKRAESSEAVRHLYRVACGLDSMIIGENEILSQVKEAYKRAESEGHCSKELYRIFESACRLGSRVRAKTKISEGKTSIASLAVEYALNQKKYPTDEVLVIGSGTIGSKIAFALKKHGAKMIFLANRRRNRAKKLAKKVNGVVADYHRLPEFLSKTSVVFTATSAPHTIIRPEMIPSRRKMLFIDLGVPYDISAEVEKLHNIKVVRLSHFQKTSEENNKKKVIEAKKVEEIINETVQRINSETDFVNKREWQVNYSKDEKHEIKKTF